MAPLEELINKCDKYFFKLEKQLGSFCASGIFKLGKLDPKTKDYKGNSQEVRYFEGQSPSEAVSKLYYELKNHYNFDSKK
jgi:hypothetical protein